MCSFHAFPPWANSAITHRPHGQKTQGTANCFKASSESFPSLPRTRSPPSRRCEQPHTSTTLSLPPQKFLNVRHAAKGKQQRQGKNKARWPLSHYYYLCRSKTQIRSFPPAPPASDVDAQHRYDASYASQPLHQVVSRDTFNSRRC